MTDDFSQYVALKNAGASAEQVYVQASRDGLDAITKIRLVRSVFTLSPGQAKEVVVRAEGLAKSLNEYQERLASNLELEE